MESTQSVRTSASYYQIQVEGTLSAEWSQWLKGHMVGDIRPDPSDNLTRIRVQVPDQAALRGMVNKIWDLNLVIISLRRESDFAGT